MNLLKAKIFIISEPIDEGTAVNKRKKHFLTCAFSACANSGVELNLVKAYEVHPDEGQPGDLNKNHNMQHANPCQWAQHSHYDSFASEIRHSKPIIN